MEEQSEDEEELWNGPERSAGGGVAQFVETRKTEGENLKKDILSKLDILSEQIGFIEERSPKIVAAVSRKTRGEDEGTVVRYTDRREPHCGGSDSLC